MSCVVDTSCIVRSVTRRINTDGSMEHERVIGVSSCIALGVV